MLKTLFRGTLDILYAHHSSTRDKLNQHIRKFDDPSDGDAYKSTNTNGFWRLILELVLNLYLVISLSVGILLNCAVVLLAWPFSSFFKLCNHLMTAEQEIIRATQPKRSAAASAEKSKGE